MQKWLQMWIVFSALLVLWSCRNEKTEPQEAVTIAPPIVDGVANEYEALGAERIPLNNDVILYIYQDDHYVWLSYTYPEGSYGTCDLTLDTSELTEPINLHVSAQLGEWPANDPEAAPQNPESELWWDTGGWTANPVWINGMDKSGETPRYRFKNGEARELQLSKEHFGRGTWQLTFEIRAVRNSEGEMYSIIFPEDQKPYELIVH